MFDLNEHDNAVFLKHLQKWTVDSNYLEMTSKVISSLTQTYMKNYQTMTFVSRLDIYSIFFNDIIDSTFHANPDIPKTQ